MLDYLHLYIYVYMENNYLNQIEKNYEIVYDHFKEQDQLRNTTFGFFTTLTVAVYGFLGRGELDILGIFLFGVMFLLGVLFSIIACRYKYFGEMYSVSMKLFRTMYDINNCKKNIIDKSLKEEVENTKLKFYSADFIIFLCLIITNSLNLIFFINSFYQGEYFLHLAIVLVIIYLLISICLYNKLVIKRVRELKIDNLSFVKQLYNSFIY